MAGDFRPTRAPRRKKSGSGLVHEICFVATYTHSGQKSHLSPPKIHESTLRRELLGQS
ncbi:hypothetical protein MPNT_190065 [Candidatus Methylacidithermus pantelleriae]|uniref:Uncharacterized protein n=1 Tax=Candidatus Methylacidithermus pantelleriae TaxID=2744239 RepID=A0A8J2BL70_9BACT|nr:hypothetical protein MPNT_190065 [Candidatus Methylacidithermus pantelleriae]